MKVIVTIFVNVFLSRMSRYFYLQPYLGERLERAEIYFKPVVE